MANSKELCLREWAPLTEILELIPVARRGFFPANLNITCIDAIEDYLALGSDAGIVFWYNRRSGEMQKLKGEVNIWPRWSMTHNGRVRVIHPLMCAFPYYKKLL